MRALQQHLQGVCGYTRLLGWLPRVSHHTLRISSRVDPLCYGSATQTCHVKRRCHVGCAGAQNVESTSKRIVFLGTPDVAATVLKDLIEASHNTDTWNIEAVVTQPGRPKGRRNKGVPQPSPVFECAASQGVSEDMIFCPVKANESEFISRMKELNPDLCVTAAYGNYLPKAFLEIPRYGTLNIHPSLLPLYRGAAPVQRSLEDGIEKTGVTVLFTVKEMDAGPVVAQNEYSVPEDMQAPELLQTLFKLGTQSLIDCLPKVWDGSILPREQDHSMATHAAKLSREEGYLKFSMSSATDCHNKVRAFAGWPGTYHSFRLIKNETGDEESVDIKVLETRVYKGESSPWCGEEDEEDSKLVYNGKDAMMIKCGDGSIMEILKLQYPGKKPADAHSFNNGLSGRYSLFQSK